MEPTAIGLIETRGLVGAIEALDTCLKAANVRLLKKINSTGGLVTIIIGGDVAAVQAAVDAGNIAAKKIGTVFSFHVIPRLSAEVFTEIISVKKEIVKKTSQQSKLPTITKCDKKTNHNYDVDELQQYKVVKLRQIARGLDIIGIERNKIKFAKKKALIDAIIAHQKGGK